MEDEVGESGTVDHLLVIGDADGDKVGVEVNGKREQVLLLTQDGLYTCQIH